MTGQVENETNKQKGAVDKVRSEEMAQRERSEIHFNGK